MKSPEYAQVVVGCYFSPSNLGTIPIGARIFLKSGVVLGGGCRCAAGRGGAPAVQQGEIAWRNCRDERQRRGGTSGREVVSQEFFEIRRYLRKR